jgi:hypothetical protein
LDVAAVERGLPDESPNARQQEEPGNVVIEEYDGIQVALAALYARTQP